MTPKRRFPLALAAALAALGLLVVLVAATATAQEPILEATAGDNEWTPLGGPMAPGGQVNALAVHPALSGTLYAAVAPPGTYDSGPSTIYKSEDGAATWTPLHESGNQIYSLAAAGSNVYAGLFNPGGEGPGLLVSDDSGASWTTVLTFPNRGVWVDLDVDPADADRAIAGGWLSIGDRDIGLLVGTSDGGDTWDPLHNFVVPGENASVNAVLIHPVTPNLLLAAVRDGDNDDTVIYRSDDGGATWPYTATIPGAHVLSLAANTTHPEMIYAGAGSGSFTWGPARIYRSTDAGLTWSEVLDANGGYVAFEPPSTVFAASPDQLWVSTSDGDAESWIHTADMPDTSAFGIDLGPSPAALYAGTRAGGVIKSTDSGVNWNPAIDGMEALVTIADLDVDPSDGQTVIAAAHGAGGFLTADGGATWSPALDQQFVNAFAIDPADPDIIYGGVATCIQASVWRSDDGGASFSPSYVPPFFTGGCTAGEAIIALDVAGSNHNTVFAAGQADANWGYNAGIIVRSPDGGASWTEVLTLTPHTQFWDLAISATDDNVVYAGGEDCDGGPCTGIVYRSTDGGDTWALTLVSTQTIYSVDIDPVDPDVVYAADGGYWVHRTEDGGDSWSVIRNPNYEPSGWRVVADPNMTRHVYLGGHGYIAESSDGGLTWSDWDAPLNSGTPNMQPQALAVSHDTPVQTLYASFSGVWAHTRLAPTEGDRYVAKTGSDDANNCTDPDAPCLTVDHALGLANPGETIFVSAGTYVENLVVGRNVSLEGGYSGPPSWNREPEAYETVLDGSDAPLIPGDWDGAWVFEPAVVHNGSEFELWFTGRNMFGESRIGRATGGPTSWTKSSENPLLDGGRAFVRLDGGSYQIWYMRGNFDGCISTAWSDDGLVWIDQPGPALCPLDWPSWDHMGIGDPSIVVDGEGAYWMYYEGANYEQPQPVQIGCATSPDGVTWAPCPENPVLTPDPGSWDGDRVADPMVLLDGSTFRMWYSGRDSDGNWSIGYATSPDGVTWTKHGSDPVLSGTPGTWDEGPVGDPQIWFDGGTLHMWYDTGWGIGYANSTDGLTWTKYPDPVLEPGWYGEVGQPVVLFEGGSNGASLDGFTVTGGDGMGGILVQGTETTVANCRVTENTNWWNWGGGIYVSEGARAFISQTAILSNTAVSAGGLGVMDNSRARLVDSTVEGNSSTAGAGGGIGLWYGSTLTATGSLVTGNSSHSEGGGMEVADQSIAILDGTDWISNESNWDGGAIRIALGGSRLEMQASSVLSNTSTNGTGGIAVQNQAHASFEGVTIRGNEAKGAEGGGLTFWGGVTADLVDVTVEDNWALYGGGGINIGDCNQVTMDQVQILGNSARWASGLRVYQTAVSGDRVTIQGNVARDDSQGGFRVENGAAMTLTNALITGNAGGAGHLWGGAHLHLSHATVADNVREDGTGGLRVEGDSSATVLNSILAYNNGPGLECDDGAACTVESSDLQYPWPGPGNISTNPRFVDRASGDYHLDTASPCIDAADPAHASDHDLDGDSRPYDGDGDLTALPDMGADEYTGAPAPIESLTDLYVDLTAPPGGDGTPDHPYQTVNEAVTSAFAGDTVHIADGTYVENVYIDVDLDLMGGYSGLGTPFWDRDPETYETVLDGSGDPLIPGDWDGSMGAPDLLWDEGAAEYKLYYHGTAVGRPRSIGLATSSDGVNWVKHGDNPILSDPAGGSVGDPSVLVAGPADYRMWFGSGNGISYAASSDGIDWSVFPEPVLEPAPGSWDSQFVSSPSVVSTDPGYLMVYLGWDESGAVGIGLATSPDGITWTRYGGNPVLSRGDPGDFDEVRLSSPDLAFAEGLYRLLYVGYDGVDWQVGAASSPDGESWTKNEGNPVIGPGMAGWEDRQFSYVSHLWKDSLWSMCYLAWGEGGLGRATSADGFEWVRDAEHNPILEPGWWGDSGSPVVSIYGPWNAELTATEPWLAVEGAPFTPASTSQVEQEPLQVVLDGLTITGGYYAWGGAGLYIQNDASVTLQGVRTTDNQALDAGGGLGIFNGARVQILASEIRNNTAPRGGGIYASRAGTLILEDSSLEGNAVGAEGGGLWAWGTSITMTRCYVVNNGAVNTGGGIHVSGASTLEFIESFLDKNTADGEAGGLMADGGATIIMEDSTISGNRALGGEAGGILLGDAETTAHLHLVSVTDNEAAEGGAGIDLRGEPGPSLTLDSVAITGNVSRWGAGLRAYNSRVSGDRVWVTGNTATGDANGGIVVEAGGAMTLTNTLIAGNAGGAGITHQNAWLYLSHATVTANQRLDGPGGLLVAEDSEAGIHNSILYYNGGTDLECAPGAVCTVTFSDLQSPWIGPGSDNISAGPQFVDWPARDYHLLATSPAIDTAGPAHPVDHDLDEEPRPYDGDGSGSAEPDMGAYEYQGDPALHDVALVGALPGGDVPAGLPISVAADLYNGGDFEEDSVPVLCTIWEEGDLQVYAETAHSGPVAPATYALVAFPDWIPSASGPYTLTCESQLPGDADPANDTFTRTGMVVAPGGQPDVWAKDNEADTGDVPSELPFWVSPDIWVRNQPDGGLVHQNPIAFEENTVYVRIRNRGDAPASGQVGVYWDRSRIGWPCKVVVPNVGVIPFSVLAPGEVRILSIPWTPEEPGEHGLHIVIDADGDPANWDARCSPLLPRWDNNVAWHNVIVFAHLPADVRATAAEQTTVYLANPYEMPKNVDLTVLRGTFPVEGTITLLLGQTLMERWLAYGSLGGEGIEINEETAVVTVTGEISATLTGLPLAAMEEREITVSFDAVAEGVYEVEFQEEIDGGAVGGLAYRWIEIDTVPPEVVSTWPPHEAIDVELDTPLVITFTEPIGPLSFDLALEPDPVAAGWLATWNPAGTVVTMTHPALKAGQTYAAHISAGDAFANPVAAYPWSFTTTSGWSVYLPVVLRNH